jgi:hypothetical protein
MNNRFDELAKGLAQSVTRRGALKKFGLGVTGIALAALGLTKKAAAGNSNYCIEWSCTDYGYPGAPYPVFVCGTGNPSVPPHKSNIDGRYGRKCQKLGPVDCSNCNAYGQCC